jgi:DNA-binding transcriptional MerR regulator
MPKDAGNVTRTLAELAQESGVAARTIRYYIARGLVPPPLAGGRGACYGEAHVERLAKIQRLQSRGLTLSQIAWKLAERTTEPSAPQPSAWWNFQIAEDVIVLVRAETAPWRLKQVRALVGQMAEQLKSAQREENSDAR